MLLFWNLTSSLNLPIFHLMSHSGMGGTAFKAKTSSIFAAMEYYRSGSHTRYDLKIHSMDNKIPWPVL